MTIMIAMALMTMMNNGKECLWNSDSESRRSKEASAHGRRDRPRELSNMRWFRVMGNAAWASCIPRKLFTTVCIAAQRSGWATSSRHCSNKRYDYGWFTLSRMWMPGGCSLWWRHMRMSRLRLRGEHWYFSSLVSHNNGLSHSHNSTCTCHHTDGNLLSVWD